MKITSFDLFDTLVTRIVADQTGFFSLVGSAAKSRGFVPESCNFARERYSAEQKARAACYPFEVELRDIYEMFTPGCLRTSIDHMVDLEEELEIRACVPIEDGLELFERAKASSDRIILISDTYHSEAFITRLLRELNIGVFFRIYVSSKHKVTKSTGDLFLLVCSDQGCKASELTHFGDNFRSDFLNPTRLGVRAKWLDDCHCPHVGISAFIRKVSNRNAAPGDAYHLDTMVSKIPNPSLWKIGYHILGPLLFGFNSWLKNEMLRRDLDAALFLSRDGRIMLDAFKIMYLSDRADYLYASRKSFVLPTEGLAPSLADQISTMSLPERLSPGELFLRIGLTQEQVEEHFVGLTVSATDLYPLDTLARDMRLEKLYQQVKPSLQKDFEEDARALRGYLKSRIDSLNSYALVDIGWHGSMQAALSQQLNDMGINAKIEGFYLGLYPNNLADETNQMAGYLFDGSSGAGEAASEVLYNALLELLFMTNHGSVERFEKRGSDFIPVFAEYEYSGLESNPVLEIQRGALDFVSRAVKQGYCDFDLLDRENILDSLKRLGLNPTKEEALLLGELPFFDTKLQPLAAPHRMTTYLLNPSKLFIEFKTCLWKPAFLKRLIGTSIPFGILLDKLKNR